MVTGTTEATVENLSDATLLARFAKARDEAAFAELVKRHGKLVWGVCRRRLARREDAEDAFQAAFLILAVKAHAIRSADALPAWLHRTACRAANRVASTTPVEASDDVPTEGLDAFAEVTRREAATAIDEELVRLPERYRNAVVLFHLEGLERSDVAARLGMSEPTVKALLSRGRAMLRTRLARRGLALPMLLPLTLDPLPAEAAASTCRLALSLTKAGLRPWDLATLEPKSLRPMTAFLSNKFVAATLVGAACLTLFFATRGDANANSDGAGQNSSIDSTFDSTDSVEPMSVLVTDAELLADAGEQSKSGDGAKTSVGGDTQDHPLPPSKLPQTQSEARILSALDENTELQFPNTPLRQALQFLADYHEINIIIDEQSLEEAGLTVDDNVDIVLSGITLRSALRIMLERYDLTYVIGDEVLKITTRENADQIVSTQAFDVAALIGDGSSVEDVARVVEQLVERQTFPAPPGKEEAARAVPRIVPFRNGLLVRASGADLKQVEEILELMSLDDSILRREQELRSIRRLAQGVEKPAEHDSTTIFKPQHNDAAPIAEQIDQRLAMSKEGRPRVAVDTRTKSIIVVGTSPQILAAFKIFRELDTPAPNVEKAAENTSTMIFQAQHADAAAIAKKINEKLVSMKYSPPRIAIDATTNSLVVVGTSPQILDAFNLFKELDQTESSDALKGDEKSPKGLNGAVRRRSDAADKQGESLEGPNGIDRRHLEPSKEKTEPPGVSETSSAEEEGTKAPRGNETSSAQPDR